MTFWLIFECRFRISGSKIAAEILESFHLCLSLVIGTSSNMAKGLVSSAEAPNESHTEVTPPVAYDEIPEGVFEDESRKVIIGYLYPNEGDFSKTDLDMSDAEYEQHVCQLEKLLFLRCMDHPDYEENTHNLTKNIAATGCRQVCQYQFKRICL